MEEQPDPNQSQLFDFPGYDVKLPERTPERLARDEELRQKVAEYNAVCIDGEWVQLGC